MPTSTAALCKKKGGQETQNSVGSHFKEKPVIKQNRATTSHPTFLGVDDKATDMAQFSRCLQYTSANLSEVLKSGEIDTCKFPCSKPKKYPFETRKNWHLQFTPKTNCNVLKTTSIQGQEDHF
jgi:hypothetical protein